MQFGGKLKEFRLHHAEMGMRQFAMEIGMKPSELSELERELAPPSSDPAWFRLICEKLGFDSATVEQVMQEEVFYHPAPPVKELYQLWTAPFVMQKIDENFFPAFICTSDGNPLSKEKLEEFIEWMNQRAREHNRKADEYNKQHHS